MTPSSAALSRSIICQWTRLLINFSLKRKRESTSESSIYIAVFVSQHRQLCWVLTVYGIVECSGRSYFISSLLFLRTFYVLFITFFYSFRIFIALNVFLILFTCYIQFLFLFFYQFSVFSLFHLFFYSFAIYTVFWIISFRCYICWRYI